jgi:hypothetical protein
VNPAAAAICSTVVAATPCSANTPAAAAKIRSRVSSRVGLTRALDIDHTIHDCIDSIQRCIECGSE